MSDQPPIPNEPIAEPPLEVDDAFAIGDTSEQSLRQVASPSPEVTKSSIIVLAIALHTIAAIIVVIVLVWKLA